MELKIFKHIDEIVNYYETIRNSYFPIAEEIKTALEEIVCANSLYSLSVLYRIKEAGSVREKMIKNSSYRIFTEKEDTIASFKDIIGLRIECKFIEDESYVFDIIRSMFDKTDDYIFYYNEQFPGICLKLCENQPQKQKNGFDIYKIEGHYQKNGQSVNFEVQIKSLVNIFWGDIEHKIIYKNNSYIVMDDLVLDNMTSIKENLNLIDRQLHQLYRRYKRDDNSQNRMRLKNVDTLMSKMIHDTIASKMSDTLGFVTDFKKSCDSAVQYLLVVSNANDMEGYGKVMLDTFYITNSIAKNELEFDKQFVFERRPDFKNDVFCQTIYQTIFKLINIDFQWHLFFLILFQMERGSSIDDTLERFIRYYKGRFRANTSLHLLRTRFEQRESETIEKDLLEEIAFVFQRNANVRFLCKNGMAELNSALSRVIEEIVLQKDLDWEREKGIYLAKLNEFLA